MIIPNSDLHTHSTFCDGKGTPEEMVLSAIEKGMDTLGFSGHAYTPIDSCPYYMTPQTAPLYREEVGRLKRVYGDRVNILLGIERDIYSAPDDGVYDYVIGSVHEVKAENGLFIVDLKGDDRAQRVRELFGDPYNYVRAYFETEAQVIKATGCTIVGHFDLISVFNEREHLFDENDPRFRRYALDALDALIEQDAVFEMNTGAIARGYRSIPYPTAMLLHRIAEKRGYVTLNSDAHSPENLMFAFTDAMRIARASGLGSVLCMTRNGWKQIPVLP